MLLELKNITKTFGVNKGFLGQPQSFVHAVNQVSLELEKGDRIGIVGESGSGKTTLARIIMKLMPLNDGEIIFNGENMTKLRGKGLKDYRRNIQMVFQDPYSSLDPRYTIRNVIKEGMNLHRDKFPTEQGKEKRIHEILGAVNLQGSMLSRYPHEFSGGERQRIAIARALVLNPKLLILDEAVSSLDVIIQDQIIQLLSKLQKEFDLTYIFISHNLKAVKKICNRIAVMYQGRIVELASADEILNNPIHPYTKELLAAAVEYKAVERKNEITIDPNAQLIDRGGGHYVIDN